MQGTLTQEYCHISRECSAAEDKLDKQKCTNYSGAIPNNIIGTSFRHIALK